MASSSDSAESTTVYNNYSFVTKKEDLTVLQLLQTTASGGGDDDSDDSDSDSDDIQFKILKGSLTANNRFYLNFGDKPPFDFFKCYPIIPGKSSLVSSSSPSSDDDDDNNSNDNNNNNNNEEQSNVSNNYAHPCVWGIAQVTESRLENVKIGTKYIAMLPIGEFVSFRTAKVDTEDDTLLIVDHPSTNPAYNVFRKLEEDDEINEKYDDVDDDNDKRYEDLALACSQGISTGFGLNFHLQNRDFYGADALVITSASSKVALALAVYLKHDNNKKKIIGYTSESNKEFCRKTGLYDEIIGYEESLNFDNKTGATATTTATTTTTKYVIVDIAGRGDIYSRNSKEPTVEIVKLLVVGNASATPFMFGAPAMYSSWTNPVQELYLVVNDLADLRKKWGMEKLRTTRNEYERIFCKAVGGLAAAGAAAAEEWISVRTCDTEESIQQAFSEIVQGTVPPSETIILDVIKAVAHRKKSRVE